MDPEAMFDDVANMGIKNGRIAIITKQKKAISSDNERG
jgi:hypothetical protein